MQLLAIVTATALSEEIVMPLYKLLAVVEDWCFVVVLGFVGTALLSYPIRMYFHKEFFERLSIQGNLLFIAVLWLFVTVFFVRPLASWWDDED